MKKKLLSAALIILLVCSFLPACNTSEDKTSVKSQISLIAQNADIWRHKDEDNIYSTDNFKFCVTDLDQNGRLEVIISAIMGTGLYSKSYYFEVDENFSALVPWNHITDSFKENLQADIISNRTEYFVNPETNDTYYIFSDSFRNTSAYNCNFKLCVTYKNETVTEKLLAFYENSAATTDEETGYEVITNIQTADGATLTDDEFFTYADAYFAGYEKHTVAFGWQDCRTEDDTIVNSLPVNQLMDLISSSYEKFTLSPYTLNTDTNNADAQLRLIAENAELWKHPLYTDYSNGTFKFCVTDLDQNGRLEIISSALMGSGFNTTSYYFEVNKDFSGLVATDNTMNKKYEPDIITEFTYCFINPDTQEMYYVFHDSIRSSGDYSAQSKMLVTLKDNTLSSQTIAASKSVAENPYDTSKRTNTYTDADGNPITISEYNTYAENYLKNYEKYKVGFGWQDCRTEGGTDVSSLLTNELLPLLEKSYNSFEIK